MSELQQPVPPSPPDSRQAPGLPAIRLAVFALMALYIALHVGSVIWAKLTSADQAELYSSQVSARLAFASTQAELIYLYRDAELKGADTRSPLLDRLGFRGRMSSQALAEAALDAYEAALDLNPLDVDSRISAAIILAYMGRQEDASLLLQKGLRAGSSEPSVLMSMLRFYSGEVPNQRWAAPRHLSRIMERLPAGRLYLISVYSAMRDVEKVEQQERIALAISKRTALKVGAVAGFLGLLMAAGVIAWLMFLFRGLPAPRLAQPAPWAARDVLEALILWVFLQMLVAQAAAGLMGQGLAALITSYVAAAAMALLWFWRASLVRLGFGFSAVGWTFMAAGPARSTAGPEQPGPPASSALRDRAEQRTAARRGALLRHVFTGVVGYTAALPVVAAILVGLRLWKTDLFPSNPLIPIFSQAPGWAPKVAILLLAVVAAPLVEETFFRGILYPAMRRKLAPFSARMASALIFSGAHLDPLTFIPLLILGAVFAYLYDRTQSLIAPAVAHALTNAVSLMILLAL